MDEDCRENMALHLTPEDKKNISDDGNNVKQQEDKSIMDEGKKLTESVPKKVHFRPSSLEERQEIRQQVIREQQWKPLRFKIYEDQLSGRRPLPRGKLKVDPPSGYHKFCQMTKEEKIEFYKKKDERYHRK